MPQSNSSNHLRDHFLKWEPKSKTYICYSGEDISLCKRWMSGCMCLTFFGLVVLSIVYAVNRANVTYQNCIINNCTISVDNTCHNAKDFENLNCYIATIVSKYYDVDVPPTMETIKYYHTLDEANLACNTTYSPRNTIDCYYFSPKNTLDNENQSTRDMEMAYIGLSVICGFFCCVAFIFLPLCTFCVDEFRTYPEKERNSNA